MGCLRGRRLLPWRTKPLYRLFDLGDFPGLVEHAAGLSIEGELWDVDAACLARLDELEGCDIGLYRRARVKLVFPHDEAAAMTYLYAQPIDGLSDCGTRWR